MGMAASQARLLMLTSRLSDLELRAQVISNAKIRLSMESSALSEQYVNALNKQKIQVFNGVSNGANTYANASVNNLVSYSNPLTSTPTNNQYRLITNNAGNLVISQSDVNAVMGANGAQDDYFQKMGVPRNSNGDWDTTTQAYKYYNTVFYAVKNQQTEVISDDNANDYNWLEQQVKANNYSLSEFNPKGGTDGLGAFQGVSWTSYDHNLQEVDDTSGNAAAEAKYEADMSKVQAQDKIFDLELKNIDTEHNATQTEIDSVKKVIDKNIERTFKMFQA